MARLRIVACSVAMLASVSAVGAPEPSSPAPGTVWDLTPLYADPASWQAERTAIEMQLPRLAALRGELGTSAASLRSGLDQISDMRRRLNRLGARWPCHSPTIRCPSLRSRRW
jgi:oligoendopeptidase F